MSDGDLLTERFEADRDRLRAVAYRMLGSLSDADDAVQEAWLRVHRAGAAGVENVGGWLTTVLARVCLDMLRSRRSRREAPLDAPTVDVRHAPTGDPEAEAALADAVGLALLVVLDRLTPAERIAFVLHDMFDVSFGEIAGIVGRSQEAARQLASRARRRVRGVGPTADAKIADQRAVVDAFLAALRAGDLEGLLAVLDPDVVVRLDPTASAPGAPTEVRGARAWAQGAVAFSRLAKSMQPALVDGSVGLVWAPRGKLQRVLRLWIANGKIVRAEVVADPERLHSLHLIALDA